MDNFRDMRDVLFGHVNGRPEMRKGIEPMLAVPTSPCNQSRAYMIPV